MSEIGSASRVTPESSQTTAHVKVCCALPLPSSLSLLPSCGRSAKSQWCQCFFRSSFSVPDLLSDHFCGIPGMSATGWGLFTRERVAQDLRCDRREHKQVAAMGHQV